MKIDIEEIKKIAIEAGKETLRFYADGNAISQKENDTPLTQADLASERIIKARLEKFKIPILSEEAKDDKSRLESEFVWIVDPLDGTSDFIQKTGEFAVMIGLVQNNLPILGVIYAPISNEMFSAEKGQGAFLEKNNEKIKLRVSEADSFSEMTILLSRNHLMPLEEKLVETLKLKKKNMGSAGLKICEIASGKAEIYINSSDKSSEWDTCAGTIILEEAGGKITDLKGKDIGFNGENPRHLEGYLVSNKLRHVDIADKIKKLQ